MGWTINQWDGLLYEVPKICILATDAASWKTCPMLFPKYCRSCDVSALVGDIDDF